MDDIKVGRRLTYIFAAIGCVVAASMGHLMYGFPGLYQEPLILVSILLGVVGLFVSAYYFGAVAVTLLKEGGYPVLTGIFTAFACLQVGVLIGAIAGCILTGNNTWGINQRVYSWVIKPILAVDFFGGLPMVILGAIYGRLLSKRIVSRAACPS